MHDSLSGPALDLLITDLKDGRQEVAPSGRLIRVPPSDLSRAAADVLTLMRAEVERLRALNVSLQSQLLDVELRYTRSL
jgi:hypothetical protein